MIEVIPYAQEHLDQITLKDCHDGEKPAKISGFAVTFMKDGEPLAIIGWHHMSKTVVQIWAFLSVRVDSFKKSFHQEVLSLIRFGFQNHSIQRMQMSVLCGYSTGWRWAKSLGFSCEGIMKKYGPNGQDYWLFARTSE